MCMGMLVGKVIEDILASQISIVKIAMGKHFEYLVKEENLRRIVFIETVTRSKIASFH